MKTIFLSRVQYDSLITHCPSWMGLRWNSYSHVWGIGGVSVTGRFHEIENLEDQLEYASRHQTIPRDLTAREVRDVLDPAKGRSMRYVRR